LSVEPDSLMAGSPQLLHRIYLFLMKLKEKALLQFLLLGAVTLLGALLRFYKLGEWSFWYDEIYTINRALFHFSDPISLITNLPKTLWLPISLIATNGFLQFFGVSEWSARLASAIIGTLSIPIFYLAARKFLGTGVALITVLLLTVSPWHIYWSQNARFYTSLTLLYVLAGFVLFYAFEFNRPKYIFLFYIIFYFALSERLIAGFIFPVLFLYFATVWLFPFEKPSGLNKKNGFFLLFPFLLILLYEGFRYLSTGESLTTDFIVTFAGQQVGDQAHLLASILYNLSFPIVILGLVSSVYLLYLRSRIGLFLFLSAVFPVLMVILINPITFTKDRYIFMTLPFWLMLASVAVWKILSNTNGIHQLLTLGLVTTLFASPIAADILYYQVNHGNRLDWRAAFNTVNERSLDGDAYVSWWPEFGPFYLGKEIIPLEDLDPRVIIDSGKRHWVILDSETMWVNNKMRNWVEQNGQLIDVMYLRLPEGDFNLRIYLYDPAIQHEESSYKPITHFLFQGHAKEYEIS
jgi:mannosyltransferase